MTRITHLIRSIGIMRYVYYKSCVKILSFIVIYYILKEIIIAEEDEDYTPRRKPRHHEVFVL